MFEDGGLRRIFLPKGQKITVGWKELHNDESRNLYYSPDITRIIK
jgi:hypothetical protein